MMNQHVPLQSIPPIHVAPRTSGMAITSLVLGCVSFFFWILTGLPAIVLGISALVRINRSNGRLKGDGLAIGGIVTGAVSTFLIMPVMIALLLPAIQAARYAAQRNQSMNNLKQIAIGLQNFADTRGGVFPAAKNEGGSQLSWRVHILPFIGEEALYAQFHLDEPWDSQHNKRLIARIPDEFRVPGDSFVEGETSYLAVTGSGTAFGDGSKGPAFQDFVDGLSRTIMIVEADKSVPWTKPDDHQFAPNNPTQGLGGVRAFGFLALMGDARVIFVPDDEAPQAVGAMMTRSGRERLEVR
jgi:hypothetical protein